MDNITKFLNNIFPTSYKIYDKIIDVIYNKIENINLNLHTRIGSDIDWQTTILPRTLKTIDVQYWRTSLIVHRKMREYYGVL